ncbi:MAG: O-antigen ligase family protein, partial [Mobilicoccus sp.]|nr:O-antigen ligase family protein [Mobilicoccus sp.]
MRRAPDLTGATGAVSAGITGVLAALVVLWVHAGGLVTLPLVRVDLLHPVYVGLAVVALVIALSPRIWRSIPTLCLVLVWAAVAVVAPRALEVAPDHVLGEREVIALSYCAVLSLAFLVFARRGGLRWSWIGWMAGLLLVGSIGVWELVTENHLWVTPERPFPFRERVAVATYVNPNNFGIVLLSMLAVALAWRACARPRWLRMLLTVAAAFAAVMVMASQSRAAVLGLLVLGVLEFRRATASRPGLVRRLIARHKVAVAALGAAMVAVVVALFTVPALAARNPVRQMLLAALEPETARSDMLRITLIREALGYWRDSGYLGTGAGSFEPINWNDPNSAIEIEANLHNAFVELLIQYGPLPALTLAALMLLLIWIAVRTRPNAALRPRVAAVRSEMLGHLVAFVALGFTASSSLALPVWWIMLAAATLNGAWLLDHTQRKPRPTLDARDAADRQAHESV